METAPGLNRPEYFAELVRRLVAAEDTPLRVPVGPDAYAYLDHTEQAARDELAAARAFSELPD
ncbi:hypothetical protein ACFQ0T_33445 [Kitasatospora gansuensis]